MCVRVENLTKNFGPFRAVDNISFRVEQGEIVGLVGSNGAGKSTVIHMLLGLIKPSSGVIHLFNRPLGEQRSRTLQRLNFMSPYMAFPKRLTLYENLDVVARIYNVPDRPQAAR